MRSIYLLIIALTCCSLYTSAQVGIGTNSPSPHAILDINSTHKGVLLPRLNAAQQAALRSTLTSGQSGMLVLDSASGKVVVWTSTDTAGWKDLSSITISADSPLSVSHINNVSINPGTAAGDLITWDGNNWISTQPAVQHFNITQNNRQPSLTMNYCIALQGIFPSRNTPYLAEIDIFSFSFPPRGWAFCNGQLLPINQNQALFSLLGTTYGGNGQTTFALPNLQGRVPLHYGTGPGGLSNYILGQTGGTEQNNITR
jgi:microcystin-dependent protein